MPVSRVSALRSIVPCKGANPQKSGGKMCIYSSPTLCKMRTRDQETIIINNNIAQVNRVSLRSVLKRRRQPEQSPYCLHCYYSNYEYYYNNGQFQQNS